MATEAKTNLVIEGKDRTGGAFASVGANAAAAGARIKAVFGAALAGAGVYMGVKGVVDGINELGHLSDIAQKANMSVDDLTKASGALDMLGIQNVGVDQFAKSLDYMQKTTGRVGMEGFYQTIEEIAKIPDTAKRGQEAVRIFGRSGMEFIPLINAAENGTQALRGVVAAYPGVSQAAATAGDNVADGMGIAMKGVKSVWLQGIGAICGWIDSLFVGGIKTAAATGAAYLEYFAKLATATVAYYVKTGAGYFMHYCTKAWNTMSELGGAIGAFIGAKMEGASFSEAWDMAKKDYTNSRNANNAEEDADLAALRKNKDEWRSELDEREKVWKNSLEERKKNIEKLAENEMNAVKGGNGNKPTGDKPTGDTANGTAAAKKSPRVQNKLVMGDSNEARKIATFGPTLQNETKKQTKILEKIAKNTEKKDGDQVDVEALP